MKTQAQHIFLARQIDADGQIDGLAPDTAISDLDVNG